jgi:hypothetical protein
MACEHLRPQHLARGEKRHGSRLVVLGSHLAPGDGEHLQRKIHVAPSQLARLTDPAAGRCEELQQVGGVLPASLAGGTAHLIQDGAQFLDSRDGDGRLALALAFKGASRVV